MILNLKQTLKEFDFIDIVDFFDSLEMEYKSKKRKTPKQKAEKKMIKLVRKDLYRHLKK